MTPRGHLVHLGHTFEIEVEGETFRFSLRMLAAEPTCYPHQHRRLIMGLDEDDAEIMKECARHLGAIAKVATATAAAEDPAMCHLERIATSLSSIAESEAAVAEASIKRCADLAEIDAANHRVALLHEQILTRDLAAAPVPLSAAVEAMLRGAELQAAHLGATHQSGLQVGRYGDLAVRLPVFEVYSAGWVQWDPATCALRRWVEASQLDGAEFRAGWGSWAGAFDLSPPTDETLCRAVPRGEADASPMSRGPLALPKAEG